MDIDSRKLGSQNETTVKGEPAEVDAWVAAFMDRMYIHSPAIKRTWQDGDLKVVTLAYWPSCD